MKKIIYISNTLVLIAMLVFSGSGSVNAQGQCLAGGCTFGGTQYPSTTFSNPGSTFVTVSTLIYGGEYQLYDVVSGNQYEWSYVTGDGSANGAGEDLQLTLFNEATTAQICYSDDYSGALPKIQWTATFTGTVRVLTSLFYCTTNTTSHTLVWRQSSGGGGIANDDCATAIPVTCSSVTTGTTVGAVADAVTICGGSPSAPGVWYSFVGNGQTMLASLCTGTSYDSRLAVYSGSCGALTCVVENDDNCGLQSSVTFASAVGTTYYILVNGYSSNTGTFTLTMAPAVTNDVCATATTITPGTYTGSTVCTGNDVVTTCGTTDGTGGGVWYQVTGSNTCSSFTASLCTGTNYDSKIRVFEGTCGALTCVTGVDDNCSTQSTVTWSYVAGTTYYILVHGYSSAEGSFTLNLSESASDATAPVLDGGGGSGTTDVAAMTNNTCMATFSQPDLAQSFIPAQNNSCGAAIYLSNTGSGAGNVTISLYSNLPNAGGVLLGSGTVSVSGPNQWATVSWPTVSVTPGVTYYLVFTGTNTSLCVAGDVANGYPNGMTYANAGYGAWPGYDYTFQTYYGCGSALADVNSACPVASLPIPTATDNCSGTVNGTTTTSFPIGASTTVVWSFDDGNGNISTYNQNVTINDNIAPTPDAVSLADVTADCSVSSLVAPTATDNCGGMVMVSNNATLPITTPGTTVVTWTYADMSGNSVTQNQNVIIDDNTAPTPDAVSLNDVTAECEVTSLTSPTATDDCGGIVTVTSDAVLPISSNTTITWTYEDENGNSTTQTQNVVLTDVTAPVPDATLSDIVSECQVDIILEPTATDNCTGTVFGISDATFPILSSTTITWTYEDASGNTSTQTQNVIINDVTAPVANEPSLATISATCEIISLSIPTATDNCAGLIEGTYDVVLPILSSTTITWSYEDANGNISTQTQEVIITGVDATVTVNAETITANNIDPGVTYQWVDCDNSNAPVAGETGVAFTPAVTGNYAVIITDGSCSEMSPCNLIEVGGIQEFTAEMIKVYPNPASDKLFVVSTQKGNLELLDVNGKVIITKSVEAGENEISVATIATGTYTVRLTTEKNIQTVQLVISRH